jgi:hypothetical protein
MLYETHIDDRLAALNIVRADFSTPATGRLEKINATRTHRADHP